MAVLEAGLMILVLGATALAGVGILDLMTHSFRISRLVDWTLTDDSARPLKVVTDGEGSISLSVDGQVMQNYLNTVRDKVRREMGTQQYYMEARYAVLHIDPRDGRVLGIDPSAAQAIYDGNYSPPSDVTSCRDLDSMLFEFSQRTQTASNGTSISLYAFPGRISGGYLESVVLVGLRIFEALEGTFTGNVLRDLGKHAEVHDCKVAVLRGDIK